MKAARFVLAVVIVCIMGTGCVSEAHRNDILTALAKDGSLGEDFVPISSRVISASPIPDIYAYVYTYSDGTETVNVTIYNQFAENGKGAYWPVEICSKVAETEHEDGQGWYDKTDESVVKEYHVKQHRVLVFKWYTVEEGF